MDDRQIDPSPETFPPPFHIFDQPHGLGILRRGIRCLPGNGLLQLSLFGVCQPEIIVGHGDFGIQFIDFDIVINRPVPQMLLEVDGGKVVMGSH